MVYTKEYERKLIAEYARAQKTLVTKFSAPLTKQAVKEAIDSTLLVTSGMQTELILTEIQSEYLAGIYLESDLLASKLPASVGFDFSGASNANLKKLTKETIGHIGKFNEEIANELKLRYGNLVDNNELLTQLDKHGWTAHTENRMVKLGFDRKSINLVKQQTTTNKMLQILEQQGIRGNIPPNEVARQLIPHIKGVFGAEGVTINNIGSVRKVLSVNADGKYKWVNKKVTRMFHTTTKNYADIIARSTIIDANRLARHQTLQQSGFVKAYRSVAVMDERTGYHDAMMHGQIVKWGDGPPYHARCRCEYEPIWEKSTGLSNRPDSFYEDKRDNFFWKRHQLKKYNATLPKGSKIPNANFLPKDMLKGMPGKAGMRKIRGDMLGQPVPVTKPKVTKPIKVVKPVEAKPKVTKPRKVAKPVEEKPKVKKDAKVLTEKQQLQKDRRNQIKVDKKIAKDLYEPTAKTGKEHALVIDNKGNRYYSVGDKGSVTMAKPDVPYASYHTHPGSKGGIPETFSRADVNQFLAIKNQKRMVAITDKNMYVMTKTDKTVDILTRDQQTVFKNRFENARMAKLQTYTSDKQRYVTSLAESARYANRSIAKQYGCTFEIIPRGGK